MRFAVCVNPGLSLVFLQALASYGLSPAWVITPQPARQRRWNWRRVDNEITRFARAQAWPLCLIGDVHDPLLLRTLRGTTVDWLAVFGFPVLPAEVLSVPRLGALGLHPSLLPAHRGAYPSYWTLRAGTLHTGFSLIQLDAGIDTGALIEQHVISLDVLDDAQSALQRICSLGAKAFARRLLRLAAGEVLPLMPQAGRTRYEPVPGAATLSLTPGLAPVELARQVAAAVLLGGAHWQDAQGHCWRILDVLHLPSGTEAPPLAAGRQLLPWPGYEGVWLLARPAVC